MKNFTYILTITLVLFFALFAATSIFKNLTPAQYDQNKDHYEQTDMSSLHTLVTNTKSFEQNIIVDGFAILDHNEQNEVL